MRDFVETGIVISAKYGRIGKAKVYTYRQHRLNKYYEQKRVEVFYTVVENVIILIST